MTGKTRKAKNVRVDTFQLVINKNHKLYKNCPESNFTGGFFNKIISFSQSECLGDDYELFEQRPGTSQLSLNNINNSI